MKSRFRALGTAALVVSSLGIASAEEATTASTTTNTTATTTTNTTTTGRCKLHNLLHHDCEKTPEQGAPGGSTGPGGPSSPAGGGGATGIPPLSSNTNLDQFGNTPAGTGGFGGGSDFLPNIIGDMSPFSSIHASRAGTGFPPFPGQPSHPAGSSPLPRSSLIAVPTIKIAENQSPLPQDRVFASFNYYQNISPTYLQRDQIPYDNVRVYHQAYGAEKTFWDGDASFGFRVPINTLTFSTQVPNGGGTHTGSGDMTFYGKYLLKQVTWSDNRAFYLTSGLSVTPPTGPHSFAAYPPFYGSARFQNFRSTAIQPFLGYVFVNGKFFFQGISAIEAPVGSGGHDVTMFYNDLSFGYFAYRNREKDAFLTAIVPSFETHINTPLDHRGYKMNDPASTPDVVNLTLGMNFELRRRVLLTFATTAPVTGPHPFDYEMVGLLNIRFGGRGASALGNVPQQPVRQ